MLKRLLIVLLFALIASPFLFKTVAGLLGSWVASNAGTPTPAGLLLHGVVFVVLSGMVWRMMKGGYRNYRNYAEEPYDEEKYDEYRNYAEEPYAEETYEDEKYEEEKYDEYRA
jgi:hypothetical protein